MAHGCIGLVLSGGGVRGIAHIGVLQALREHEIEVSHFAGTSAGALVALMAAADCPTEKILEFWTESDPFRIQHLTLDPSGAFDPGSYVDHLKTFVPYETFEELPHSLTVTVTAMVEGSPKYIEEGPLWPIVLASAAYPVVFSPVYQDDEVYMDGGITDNYPLSALEGKCDFTIGVNVSPHRCVIADDLQSIRGIMERVMDLGFRKSAKLKDNEASVLIEPEFLSQYGAFVTDEHAVLDIYRYGLEAGYEAIPQIVTKLQNTPNQPLSQK